MSTTVLSTGATDSFLSAPSSSEPVKPDLHLQEILSQVIQQKRELLDQTNQQRFQGTNRLREAIYVTSDVSTAGFSVAQGVTLLVGASPAFSFAGSIMGIVGGALNMGQGAFLLLEASRFLKNGQLEQAARIGADALLLIGIGLIMTLVSLSTLGIHLGAVGALKTNPYIMPILILLLVLPGLLQTGKHLSRVCLKQDIGSRLLDPLLRKAFCKEMQERLLDTKQETPLLERVSQLMETFTEELGVEAGVEAMKLLRLCLQEEKTEEIEAQVTRCQKEVQSWNRAVALRALQLSLYTLTFPLGLSSAFLKSNVAAVINATSKFFLTAPSTIAGYLDLFEPFKRNGAIAVPKVAAS